MQNFTKLHFKNTFTMRDIRRTFKTLAGVLHFSENERDIVNQYVNKTIGKKYYDKYDYFIEKRETTLKWEKAINILLKEKVIQMIEKIAQKEEIL